MRRRLPSTGSMPNRIWLYRRPILDYWAEHEETLGDIVTHVLVHEIGHHFGLSDEDIDAIEADAADRLREKTMLALRPNCECCDRDLPPDSADARICTFECTFCADCVDTCSAASARIAAATLLPARFARAASLRNIRPP